MVLMIEHGALRMRHWALGIGHGALGIGHLPCPPRLPHLPCTDGINRVFLHSLLFVNKEALAQLAAGIAAKTAPSQITLLNG